MNPKELMGHRYAKLCQRQGHLQNSRRKIDIELASLQQQIDALDIAVTYLEPKLAAVSDMPQPDRTGPKGRPPEGDSK